MRPTFRHDLPAARDLDPIDLVGQLLCVALRDYAGDREAARAFLEGVEAHRWGGVIVFGGDPEAVRELVAEADRRLAAPLLVTGDFERGAGQQFPGAGTAFPPLMALGAAGDPALARAAGRAVGLELRGLGFHVDFWPVADLATERANPIVATRAAGDDPARAAAIVAAVVEGLQAAGVAAAVKHFPGHGRTTLDSHDARPVVDAPRAALEAELEPFRAGLAAGARIVMPAHVAFPALEPDDARDRPATFSRAITTGLLRDGLGFDGLVCSDALMMGAVAGAAPEDAALQALAAGVDWLLYPPDPPRVHAGLVRALASSALESARAAEAAERVLALKQWARAAPGDAAGPALPLAEAVAGAALTADPPDPPRGAAWADRAQWVVVLDGGLAEADVVLGAELAPAAAERIVVVDTAAPPEVVAARIDEARRRAAHAFVACAAFSPVRAWKGRPGLSAAGRAAVEAACGPAREAVLLIFSDPRIVREVDAPARVVWAYGEDAASQRAALAFLRGALPATGRLPVAL